ncbi:IS1 family transposase [Escherichia coli]
MASVSISCPSCSATDGVVRNGKSTAGHQRYLGDAANLLI